MNLTVDTVNKRANVEDFYVLPEQRRQGFGKPMVRRLLAYFDSKGIQQIDLNVR
jgi:ribosomal protein S18 acetylase RimI-like enzyme